MWCWSCGSCAIDANSFACGSCSIDADTFAIDADAPRPFLVASLSVYRQKARISRTAGPLGRMEPGLCGPLLGLTVSGLERRLVDVYEAHSRETAVGLRRAAAIASTGIVRACLWSRRTTLAVAIDAVVATCDNPFNFAGGNYAPERPLSFAGPRYHIFLLMHLEMRLLVYNI